MDFFYLKNNPLSRYLLRTKKNLHIVPCKGKEVAALCMYCTISPAPGWALMLRMLGCHSVLEAQRAWARRSVPVETEPGPLLFVRRTSGPLMMGGVVVCGKTPGGGQPGCFHWLVRMVVQNIAP